VTDEQCASVGQEEAVLVTTEGLDLHGTLILPGLIRGAVMLVDERATCQMEHSQRTLATRLNSIGIGVLAMELLSHEEQMDRRLASYCRSHIELMAGRIVAATDWLANARRTRDLPIGYFGTSTGAAAALAAAASAIAAVSECRSRRSRSPRRK